MSRPAPGFTLVLDRPEPPEVVWAGLWDLDRHTAAIPLTEVARVDARPLALGARFTARTALGALGFDDRMVVRRWEPPHVAVIEKAGPVLGGTIVATLVPRGDGCRVVWQQTLAARGVPELIAAVVAPAVRAGYRASLRRILAS